MKVYYYEILHTYVLYMCMCVHKKNQKNLRCGNLYFENELRWHFLILYMLFYMKLTWWKKIAGIVEIDEGLYIYTNIIGIDRKCMQYTSKYFSKV